MMEFWRNLKKSSHSDSRGGLGTTPLSEEMNQFSQSFETTYTFDYFTFSFPFKFQCPMASINLTDNGLRQFNSFLSVLNLNFDVMENSFGTKGFRYGYMWPVPVRYAGQKKPTTRFDYYLEQNKLEIGCFELSGSCCRDFERRYMERYNTKEVDEGWFQLFNEVIESGGSPSRLDVAFDIFNADEDHQFLYYLNKLTRSEFNSPIGIVRVDTIYDDRINAYTKQIVNLGGDNSDVKICIYNKKLEQEAQNLVCFYSSWIRIEMRFQDRKAKNILVELVENWENRYEYLVGILKHYLQFKIRPETNHGGWFRRNTRVKWLTDPYWQNLFMDAEKKKITNLYDKVSTVDSLRAYLMQNYNRVGTILSLSMDKKERDIYMTSLYSKGFENLKPGDLEKINYFRHERGLKEYTLDELMDRMQDVEIDKAKLLEDPSAAKYLENLEVEKVESLKKVFSSYQKTKNRNEFIRELVYSIGDKFDAMTDDDLRQLFDSMLLLMR